MSVLGRLVDARNTVEGKVLSVFMAALLIVSTFNVSAWAAEKSQESSETLVTEVNDKQAPEQPKAEPEKPAAQPEADKPATEPEVEKTTAQLENATPRPEAEAPAQAPAAPVEEKAADVALKLKVQDATLTYDGKAVAADAKELTVPAGKDVKFTVAAADGFQLGAKAVKLVNAATLTYDGKAVAADAKELTVPAGKDVKFTVAAADGFQLGAKAVKLVNAAGVECELTANSAGEYTVPAEKLEAGATIQVTAEPVVAEEPAAPTQPATPVVPTDDPTEPSDEPATPEVPEAPSDSATTEPGTILDNFLDIFGGGSTLSITDEDGNSSVLLAVGESKTVTSNSGSYNYYTRDHKWSVSKSGVVTVSGSEASATITGVSAGEVTVTHSYQYRASSVGRWRTDSDSIKVKVADDLCTVTFDLGASDAKWTGDYAMKWRGTHRVESGTRIAEKASELGYPTRDGYVFAGWSPAISFIVADDATYTAQWIQSQRGYTPVYVYTQVEGDTSGLVLNKDGWFTLGVIMLPNSVLGNGTNVTLTDDVKMQIAEAIKSINRFPANASINLDSVNWTELHKVEGGASDYTGEKNVWHLDGKLKVERISALQINHLDRETGAALRDPENKVLDPGTEVVSSDYQKSIKNYTYISADPESATTVANNRTVINLY